MRYLVVANQTLGGRALTSALAENAHRYGAQIHVVVPAREVHDKSRSGEEAVDAATGRLNIALERLRAAGIQATGTVGPADPMEAVREAMAADTFDVIVISTLPAGVSRWIHMDLPHRVQREFQRPVEWIEARTDSPDEPTTINIELPRAIKHSTQSPDM